MFAVAVFADQLLGDAAVLCEHQQADRVDVEPAGRRQGAAVGSLKGDAAVVALPAVFFADQFDGGAVAFFRLRADETDGLVQQHRYPRCLLLVRLPLQLDAVGGSNFFAEYGGAAVYFHPAFFDVGIGFAARAQPEFGHAFGKADGVGRCGRIHGGRRYGGG